MTSELWVGLLGGGAAGTLLASFNGHLTGWIGRNHERRRWRQDHLLEAYVAFGTALNGCQTGYVNRLTEPHLDSFREAIQQLATARQQALLLAPPEDTRREVDGVMEAARDALFATAQKNEPEALRLLSKMMDHSRELLPLQQRDLGTQTSRWWKRSWRKLTRRSGGPAIPAEQPPETRTRP